MKERLFRFKCFSVYHEYSAMKVGVDGVLTGAWSFAPVFSATNLRPRILDVGCGCGLISLMLAQRSPESEITAIDIHEPSIYEARRNFASSIWDKRLKAVCSDWSEYASSAHNMFDLIISNPPFFDAGTDSQASARMQARHVGSLSPCSLIKEGHRLLAPGGRISLIAPLSQLEKLMEECKNVQFYPRRITYVSGVYGGVVKRILFEVSAVPGDLEYSHLSIEYKSGVPTMDYRLMTKDFYIKF